MDHQPIVIIMAGGLGKRMQSDLPKVLHQVKHEPMIVRVIKQAVQLNPKKIFIVVGKYRYIIEHTIQQYIHDELNYVMQDNPKGTGHAIQCCLDQLDKYQNHHVLILSGDNPLISVHTMRNMLTDLDKIRILVTNLPNTYGYGRIMEYNNRFSKIIEEKDCTPEQRLITKVNCGTYACQTDVLCKYLPQLTNNNVQQEYYLTDIIEIIKNQEQIDISMYEIPLDRQYEISGVNTKEQLDQLNLFMDQHPEIN